MVYYLTKDELPDVVSFVKLFVLRLSRGAHMKFNAQVLFQQYMSMHQNPINRWLHVGAMAGVWTLLLLAVFRREPVFLLYLPLTYTFAISGHYLFEKNQPTFARYIREHGWKNWRGLLLMVVVEELCVARMALEQFGLVRRTELKPVASSVPEVR